MDNLSSLVVTFNCGRRLIKPEIFARHLAHSFSDAEIPHFFVLCLQEIAPIAYSFLGGSYLVSYFDAFHHAIHLASKSVGGGKYISIATRNVGMTAIIAFVREDIIERIRDISDAGVGVGVQEMGNKGAVGIRFGYAIDRETLWLSFIAAHLTPMEDALKRRNEDWMRIVRGLVFQTIDSKAKEASNSRNHGEDQVPLLSRVSGLAGAPTSALYTRTSHLVLAGDLNYRTSTSKPLPLDYQGFPQPTEDTGSPFHYYNLLANDQLSRELKANRTCHGLLEAPIDFPPTYKYSGNAQVNAGSGDGSKWNWSTHRWPSWCDRVLYMDLPNWMKIEYPSAEIHIKSYTALPLMSTSDHRAVALSFTIPAKVIPPPSDDDAGDDVRAKPPFEVDPEWKDKRASARRKEVVVGLLSYVLLTWEGEALLLGVVIGAVGGWAIIRSLVEV